MTNTLSSRDESPRLVLERREGGREREREKKGEKERKGRESKEGDMKHAQYDSKCLRGHTRTLNLSNCSLRVGLSCTQHTSSQQVYSHKELLLD